MAPGHSNPVDTSTVRLGISTCLLGERVRHDGGHKRDTFLTDVLGRFVEWVPVCPEVEMGLGVPRPTIRLEGEAAAPRLIEPRAGTDLTRDMRRFAVQRVRELGARHLHGYVLKSHSPSCGVARVPVHRDTGRPLRTGRGAFAAVLTDRLPLLPVEDEGRLHDVPIRENFIARVFAYKRWSDLLAQRPRAEDLGRFHMEHQLTLLSHSRSHYTQLGRLVAQAGTRPQRALLAEYGATFMAAFARRATPKKHAVVLLRLLHVVTRAIDGDDRAEVLECIERYRTGQVPRLVPLTLLQHHLRRHPADGVMEQTYLRSHPAELLLRNHV